MTAKSKTFSIPKPRTRKEVEAVLDAFWEVIGFDTKWELFRQFCIQVDKEKKRRKGKDE